MSCRCPEGERRWLVRDYKCNYSRFRGGQWTPSDYSAVYCLSCRSSWRTRAKYVRELKHMTEQQQEDWVEGKI